MSIPTTLALMLPLLLTDPATDPLAATMPADPPFVVIEPVLPIEPPTVVNCTNMPSLPAVVIVPPLVMEPPTDARFPATPVALMPRLTVLIVPPIALVIEPETDD